MSTIFQLTTTALSRAAVVYDMNGREASDVEPVLNAVGDVQQYIFCSSAGVYLKSDQMPHREEDATDPKSRHKVCACCLRERFLAVTDQQSGTERPSVRSAAPAWGQRGAWSPWLLQHRFCVELALQIEGVI